MLGEGSFDVDGNVGGGENSLFINEKFSMLQGLSYLDLIATVISMVDGGRYDGLSSSKVIFPFEIMI